MKTIAPKLAICLGAALLILLMDSSTCVCQSTQMEDVVYLKNGGIIRGTIIEMVPEKSLKIETKDGNVFVFTMDEVERFTREAAKLSASNVPKVGKKNGGIAFALSFLIAGGGQFYNGESGKGAIMLGGYVFGITLMTSGYSVNDGFSTTGKMGLFLWLGSALWSWIDAPFSSARINRENGYASIYRVSDNLYVDVKMSNFGSQSTPCIQAVLSF
jgi:hypothetical protein